MKKQVIIGAAAVSLIAPLAFGEVIYENDFATRTSAGVVPMSEWRTYDYVADFIANTNGAAPFATYGEMQDGWIKVADDTNHNTYCENAHVWAGASGNGNPAVVLGRKATANASSCVVKQRLGNTFTSGTLTAQFDFMPPGTWVSYGNADTLRRVNLSFGDERFYSPDVLQNGKIYNYTACGVGVAIHGPEGNRQRKVWYNADVNYSNTNMTEQTVTQGAWLRAVVTIDLDARKWGFSMYEMGASQPAMTNATPATPVYTRSNLPFTDNSVTGISSIALVGIGVCWNSSAFSNSTTPKYVAWFDNIRISHNGNLCYENDFATRRWRTLGGTASHTYVADCLVTNRVEKEIYVPKASLVPDRENTGTTVQTPGIDGWRRINKDSTANADARNDTVDGASVTYLRFDCSKSVPFAYLANLIGTTLSSGKVRLAVDARLPSGWAYDSAKASVLWVTLGSASYYGGVPTGDKNYNNYRWAAVGLRAQEDGTKATYLPPGSASAVNTLPNSTITAGYWYRIVIEADIDAGNFVYKIYEQGEKPYPTGSTADGTLIYTSPTVTKRCSINTISSFSLCAYYCPVYFDNLKIWHTPTGSESATLLYENYFSSRTIYSPDTRVAPLIGTIGLNSEGQDGWTRVYNTAKGAFVDWADNNPSLTFEHNANETYAVQDIGQTVKSGTLVAQADIRPPKGWLASGASTYVRLCGDAFRQGNLRTGDSYFLNNIAMGFGFKNANSGKSFNLYTNSTIVAYRGNLNAGGAMESAEVDVDTTHWYRFVATSTVTKNQYDVSVYDMGATHPTLATATPAEPVATFSALPFRRAKADLGGISCISISGHKNMPSIYDQSLQPMIDNIRISHTMFGTRISIK